jgi:nucleoside phosphorylase
VTAIILATRNEASRLLPGLSAVKDSGIFHYRGTLADRNVVLYITRPGVASKEQVRRFLRLYKYDRAILAGSCASLSAALTHLQTVRVAQAVSPGEKTFTLADSGVRAVSVRHLVVDDASKADLRAQTGADILDMETHTLAQLFSEAEFAALPFAAVRVIDDLAGEEKYLQKERALREMTLRTPTGRAGFTDILRLGLWDFALIMLRRRRVAAAIQRAVVAQLSGK